MKAKSIGEREGWVGEMVLAFGFLICCRHLSLLKATEKVNNILQAHRSGVGDGRETVSLGLTKKDKHLSHSVEILKGLCPR